MSTVAPSLFPTSICSRRLEHWEIEAITKGINQSIDPKPSDAAQIASLCQGYYSGVEQCLVKARSMGYPVISFNVLLEMLKEDLRRGTGMFTTKGPVVEPPRKTLDTETRLKSLESTIEQVSQKLSKLTEDVSGISQSSGSCNTQTTREVHEELGALLRSLREQTLKSSDNGGVTSAVDIKSPTQAASPTKQQSDALQALLDPVTERVAVLENVLNSVQDKINTFQPNLCNNHCKSQIQKLEEKFNELQRSLELLALADTAGSTDGMLTPTSTVLNGFNNNHGQHVVFKRPITLLVTVYLETSIYFRTLSRSGSKSEVLVKMYPDVRFKILADKLLQKYHGNRQLRLDDATCTQVYDSDTPASLKLQENARLIFADVADKPKTLDLTIV